jgi:hypothetical protein
MIMVMRNNKTIKWIIFSCVILFFLNIFTTSTLCLQQTSYTLENDGINTEKYDSNLPSSFSWLDINGTNFATPIKNQAPCPSCEAYALVAALETIVQYKVGYPFGCDLSEMHLFFYSGGTSNWGVDVKKAADYLVEYGVPDEGCYPDPHRSFDYPFESLIGWENRTVKIQEWGWVENDIDSIKQALIEYGPLVICVTVRTDFMVYKGGIYRNIWGEREGGHLITIFGYNDNQRYWLIKNSWGTEWGEDGWIRVSYDADTLERPFIRGFYGGTGILYINGVYGNLQPDVPKIYIEKPHRGLNYFNNLSWKFSLLRKLFIKRGEAIIIKGTNIELTTSEDTSYVEFFIDNEMVSNLSTAPFQWYLPSKSYGLHELKVVAYNDRNNASQDIMDIFTIPLTKQ